MFTARAALSGSNDAVRAVILVVLALGVLSFAGACWRLNSGSDDTPPSTPTGIAAGKTPTPAASGTPGAPAPSGGQWLVAFAANFDSSAPCHEGALDGCDIYLAGYDDTQGTVSDLIKVAGQDGIADYAPALSPDGCWVAYDSAVPGHPASGFVAHVPSAAVTALPDGMTSVAWAPDGNSIAWAANGELFVRAVIKDCAAATITFGPPTQVTKLAGSGTTASAPTFTPDGDFLAAQVDGAHPGQSKVELFGINGGLPEQLTQPDGAGHPTVRSDGGAVAFDGGDAVLRIVEAGADGQWGSPRSYVITGPPGDYARSDPRYATCDSVLPSHPLWVGTDALAYDLACEQGQDTAFAHLWATTVDVTDAGHTIDLSRLLEDLAGLVRKDFFDASIIPLPQSGRAGESIV